MLHTQRQLSPPKAQPLTRRARRPSPKMKNNSFLDRPIPPSTGSPEPYNVATAGHVLPQHSVSAPPRPSKRSTPRPTETSQTLSLVSVELSSLSSCRRCRAVVDVELPRRRGVRSFEATSCRPRTSPHDLLPGTAVAPRAVRHGDKQGIPNQGRTDKGSRSVAQ